MSYVIEELAILDSLKKSNKLSKSDKAFLEKLSTYAVSVIQEKKLKEKKENLEGVLFNILELINDKIEELKVRAEQEYDEFLVEKINLKIQELKVLRRRIILDNKVYLDKMIKEADTTKEGEGLIVDVLGILTKNSGEMVTPDVVNYKTVDALFRRIFGGINIGAIMTEQENLEHEAEDITLKMHDELKLSRALGLSIEHFNIVERYTDRIREQLMYEQEIDDLTAKKKVSETQLRKLEKRRIKFNSTKKKIRGLVRRIESAESILEQKEQLLAIANEHVSNTQGTMRRIGLGELANEIRGLRLSYDPETNYIMCPELKSYKDGITVLGTGSIHEVAISVLEQTNKNYVYEEQNKDLLEIMRETVKARLVELRSLLEVNRNKKYAIEDLMVERILGYLHKVTVVNGQLSVSEKDLAKYARTSFVALFGLKTLIDLRKDLVLEEVPQDLLIKAEIEDLEAWFRTYTNGVYESAVASINSLENDKDYSINK